MSLINKHLFLWVGVLEQAFNGKPITIIFKMNVGDIERKTFVDLVSRCLKLYMIWIFHGLDGLLP